MYRDVNPAWVRGEFLAAARKRYGVFERTAEEVQIEKREEEKTGTKTGRRRIVGRRST